VKREIHIWSEGDNFKALLYQQGELQGIMLDFYLQFILQLEKPSTQKCYYIVHIWIRFVLKFMHLEEGNAREKITQCGIKNLHNMNGLEDIPIR